MVIPAFSSPTGPQDRAQAIMTEFLYAETQSIHDQLNSRSTVSGYVSLDPPGLDSMSNDR